MAGSGSEKGTSTGVLQQSAIVQPQKQRRQLDQNKAHLLVRAVNKARGHNNMKPQYQQCTALLLSKVQPKLKTAEAQAKAATAIHCWVCNAPKAQELRIAKVTAQQCLIAVAEHTSNQHIMLKRSEMSADMVDKGIVNAKHILDNSSELCKILKGHHFAYKRVRAAITDEKFREKLCCLKYHKQQHWKYFDPIRR